MNLNVLCLYPNVMDLYGDNANIDILKYRAKQRNIDINIDTYTIGDEEPNFYEYDLVFLGGGSDTEQKVVAKDIIKYQKQIERSINKGIFYLLVCGGFQLFGKYYKDSENKVIKGLNIFNYYTETSSTKNEKCIGDIVIESVVDNHKIELVGFENHGGQTFGIDTPLGKVRYGNGNSFKNEYEGFMKENVIGTYLHGPLLSKNPELADYILKYCLERKYNKKVNLKKIDDEFENIAKKEMLDKLLVRNI
ncbi:MAG: glutamine amidotransferase [Firmicutes bacterium]|nr:glutamine amidotransferase [Bacillota bacterium]